MIGFLQGRPIASEGEALLILVQGVGYEVYCSQNTRDEFEAKDFVEAWVHTHVREDALSLFAFASVVERQVFVSLLKVNGIGPKSALKILSAAPLQTLLQMIEDGDVRSLSKLPKVGKKTAEQIVLTLKGQLVSMEDQVQKAKFPSRDQVISALLNLGFRLQEVESVVDQLDPQLDVQEGLRQSLSALTN